MKTIKLTRAPARVAMPGTFALPGFPGVTYTYGHDAVLDYPLDRIGSTTAVDIEGAGKGVRDRYDVKSVTFGTNDHALNNSPFDAPILFLTGMLELDSLDFVTDTLIYARSAEPDERTSKNLMNCANRHLGLNLTDPLPAILKALGISKTKWFADFDMDTPNWRHMAAADVILTFRLLPVVRNDAFERQTVGHPFARNGVTGAEAYALIEREQILNRDSLRRTCRGFRTDPDYADEYRLSNASRMAELRDRLENAGITPGHSGSLTKWLDERMLIPDDYPRTAKTKAPSGLADHLKLLNHELAKIFVEHKRTEKVDKDYLAKVLDQSALTGRIHPALNFLGAATGRNSMDNPPVQQFPGPARGIIVPEDFENVISLGAMYYDNPDHEIFDRGTRDEKVVCHCPDRKMRGFVSIDWSQIEPVLAANIAGDVEVLAGYEDGSSDLYSDIAKFANVIRKTAKVILLAQLYGEGLLKLAVDLGLITPAMAAAIRAEFQRRKKANKERQKNGDFSNFEPLSQVAIAADLDIEGFITASEIRDKVFEPIPKTREYMNLLRNVGQEYQCIPTLSGRIIPIPSGYYDGEWSVQTHKAINYTFQGGAYDVLADTLLRIHDAGLRDAVYFPMHDELIANAEAAYDIRKIMETPPARLVELTGRTPVLRTDMAHLGERWYAA